MPTTAAIAAGLATIYVGTLDSAGILVGSTTTAPSAGSATGSSMYRAEGGKTAGVAVPTPDVVTQTGDNIPQGALAFPATDVIRFQLGMAIYDQTLAALVDGTKVATYGNTTLKPLLGASTSTTITKPDLCAIIQRDEISKTSGERGLRRWGGILIPRLTMTDLFGEFTERQFTDFNYDCFTNSADTFAWGETMSASTHGVTECHAYSFHGLYPRFMQRWTGDNTATAFTLSKTVAASSANSISVWVNGSAQTYTTHFTASGTTLTFGSAPANNSKIVAFYEYV